MPATGSRERFTKIQTIVSIVGLVLAVVLAQPIYVYLQEYVLSTPKVEVEHVGNVIISWTGEYTPIWNVNFTITLFVSSAHDFKLRIESTSFRLDPLALQYLEPDYISTADVSIYGWFETHGSASQRMENLVIPVLAYLWIRPESIVWQGSFPIGTMSARITVTDLHNNLTDSKLIDVQVWWKK